MSPTAQAVLVICGPLISGLAVATLVGIIKIVIEFKKQTGRLEMFETIVREELRENRDAHLRIYELVNSHADEEMGLIRELQIAVNK